MVTRKPVPDDDGYIDTNAALRVQDMRKELSSATHSPSTDAGGAWDDAPHQKGIASPNQQTIPQDVPESLRPGGVAAHGPQMRNGVGDDVQGSRPPAAGVPTTIDTDNIPLVLRPGPSPARSETNPFKRKEVLADSTPSSPPTNSPPPMPPLQPLSQMSTGEMSNNPWQPALDQHAQRVTPVSAQQSPHTQDSGNLERNAWAASQGPKPPAIPTSPALLSLPSEPASPAWDELPENQTRKAAEAPRPIADNVAQDQHAWEDVDSQNKGKGKAPAPVVAPPTAEDAPMDDWNLIDVDPPAGPPPGRSQAPEQEQQPSEHSTGTTAPPALPPRNDQGQPPRQPPRPVDSKSETYQIKNIAWYDHSTEKNPRISPILVQNANGPCPLLALVNALTLTTPPSLSDTALVQVLRSREQISLGYLLDAVVDELMRRTQESLPDVSLLYEFLKGLHTGMNVNPRFVPTPEIVKAFKRTSLTHLHPTERDDLIPGTFEDTNEMSLYSAFAIPLIHGWLPSKDDPAYAAFERQAASFEDVQTLLFRDEELQEKLGTLTEEEEEIYSDIQSIKEFLDTSATQLTQSGLDVITKAMKPGSFAILFRNDHFSTLYRHPTTQQLLVLVTDAGYATHDEVVWESLADVNGERTEYYSGDFRIVGGEGQQSQGSSRGRLAVGGDNNTAGGLRINTGDENGEEWTTVQGRGRQKKLDVPSKTQETPMSPNHEQEDRDLALALQLQEEEEQRHRAEQSARRRESLLSEQYIEQQARLQQGPTTRRAANRQAVRAGTARSTSASNTTASLNSRRNSNSSSTVPPSSGRQPGQPPQLVRPLVPPMTPARRQGVNRPADEGIEDAPPTYEQAQAAAKYEPPPGHPHHHASSPTTGRYANGAGPSFPLSPPRPMVGGGRGRIMGPGGVVGSSQGSRERDCIVM
ncbi:hypothetical protein LX36DRAFT_325307 [Colletotrichum falcatum]|nr:hypothetical protein LX36DRAFT_325307 [Colletotrichum falcatum]